MPTRPPAAPTGATYPIQVVARRTGLSADVVRSWEKRYAVVAPERSASGRRLYSDADIERLQLLARATLTGHTIGQLAARPTPELAALVRDGGRATPPMPDPGTGASVDPSLPAARDHLDAALEAIARFDGVALDLLLRRATVALSAEAFLGVLVVPLAAHVDARVRDGSLRPSHGHLAHAVLRRVLDHVIATATSPMASPDLVVTTPSGQRQELGALVCAAVAAAEGWRVTYVGPGLPAEDIADAVVHARAVAVVLSLGAAPGDRVIPRELRRLRTLLRAQVAILVEGAATEVHRSVLGEIDAFVLPDLSTLRARLRALRAARGETTRPPTRRRAPASGGSTAARRK